jgi:hypothetical protein
MIPREHALLKAELNRLAGEVYATNAFVFDAWGLVWCCAVQPLAPDEAALLEQIKTVLSSGEPRLQSGGRISRTWPALNPPLHCRSFAGVYVLGLWVTSNSTEFLLRPAVTRALPLLESLTLALPPPGGHDPNSGAQHGRA